MAAKTIKGAGREARPGRPRPDVEVTLHPRPRGPNAVVERAPPDAVSRSPAPARKHDPVARSIPRPAAYDHALCLNSAFGGSNAALVVSRHPFARNEPQRRPVGMVGPFGLAGGAAHGKEIRSGGRVPRFAIERVVPRADPRGLDPMSRFLTAAAAVSLEDAGVKITGRRGERTGLIAGAVRPSGESVRAFSDSVTERGLRQLSAHAFARIVLNAPAGFCSKLLSLRGPLTVVSVGSGLLAALLSAEFLSTRDDADLMIAAGVDEQASEDDDGGEPVEGAACLLLGHCSSSPRDGPSVRVAGWSVAGPGALDSAMAQVRHETGNATADQVFDERDFAGSARPAALPSALALAAATIAIRRAEIDRAWVVSDAGRSMSAALLLTA